MGMIETTKGPMDESQLVKSTGLIESDFDTARWVEYRIPETGECVATYQGVVLLKGNVFAEPPADGMVPTSLGTPMPVDGLEKRLETVDNENEYTSVVEYRLPGSGEIVHRSVDVKLKSGLPLDGVAGGIG